MAMRVRAARYGHQQLDPRGVQAWPIRELVRFDRALVDLLDAESKAGKHEE